ncbi:hypothetical protein PN483_06135 [Nodularia spumigena CS-591/04]|uniref:hypothetical protein n=1 Tax=Nodularia spumigena TaxID=70799 RepID=UPI002330A998|nr:hypothetical protein [Nodularia spumigena]MDB9321846.1 hypothetical protein [Nodularia spumigena CS-591/07A]MDB9330070.1 hypothetical protein [Nodularia spumigena CS-591/04]MDB9350192.1 hypothetical protein [Nodularia spumigena CS-588/01]MDB9354073.1 hypothetical protein [Nodularia spumigena CS-588/05]
MELDAINSVNGEENTSISDDSALGPPFEGLDAVLAENLHLRDTNNLSGMNGGNTPVLDTVIDPFAGDVSGQLNELIFGRLDLIQSQNSFDGVDNAFVGGGSNSFPVGDSSSFNQDNAPVGNGNRNFGSDNATIGNSNSDYGSDSATIGNGNWNFNDNNATIGNGNWLFASDNTTLGNGNWYWDDGSNNATLGNGNWQFNSDNSTIGNGNWGFGNNNTTIGNGNWGFGNNNTIIGNGNWDFGNNNTIIGNGKWIFDDNNIVVGDYKIPKDSELIPPEFQGDVDSLINSLIGSMGEKFLPLTGDLGGSETETFNRLILSQNNGNMSTDVEEFLALLNEIQTNAIAYQHWQKPQPVPESASSVSLVVVGLVYLLLSKLKQGFCRQPR